MAQQYHCRGVHGVLQRLWFSIYSYKTPLRLILRCEMPFSPYMFTPFSQKVLEFLFFQNHWIQLEKYIFLSSTWLFGPGPPLPLNLESKILFKKKLFCQANFLFLFFRILTSKLCYASILHSNSPWKVLKLAIACSLSKWYRFFLTFFPFWWNRQE